MFIAFARTVLRLRSYITIALCDTHIFISFPRCCRTVTVTRPSFYDPVGHGPVLEVVLHCTVLVPYMFKRFNVMRELSVEQSTNK